MSGTYCLQMIETLRREEVVVLYGQMLQVPVSEEDMIADFLHREFISESQEYPGSIPAYDTEAAVWAAKTVNTAAQLMLYRKGKPKDLTGLLPSFSGRQNVAAILSADLCLRFLPDMLLQLKIIDPEDELIEILERILRQWHFSAVRYKQDIEQLNFEVLAGDECLLQLYTDRIIANKHMALAMHTAFKSRVQASLGIYANEFWNNFNTELEINEQ